MALEELEILDGDYEIEGSVVILDAEFARKAIASRELELAVDQALRAMELSGKRHAYLRETDADS